MTTESQVKANQQNALQSTGPRTPDGKARAALNVLRHGLTASTPLLPDESPDEYERFVDGVVDELEPITVLQSSMALTIANKLWRLRRVAQVEAGMLASKLKPGPLDLTGYDTNEQVGLCYAFVRAFDGGAFEPMHRYENHLEAGLYKTLAAYAVTKRVNHAEPVEA